MNLLDRIDRIVRPIAIPNLTALLVGCQFVFWIFSLVDPTMVGRGQLVWDAVLAGEVWRLATFLLIAPTSSPIFAIFYFYLLYMMGTALEQQWGIVRYCSFIYIGVFLTIAAAAVAHDQVATGLFLYGTIFLAFATYNPNFEFLLFFVLPVKIKYLAWLQIFVYLLTFVAASLGGKLMVVASVSNYLIFFGRELLGKGTNARRRMSHKKKEKAQTKTPRHVCHTCGIDSNTNPEADFRYCSQCDGHYAYCQDHLRDHKHVNQNAR
ncbi:hypothetical protein K227x_43880 [Rubripirellula lacrimiformis]|uniref:Peptidase S54 rhomboid domain-containing protein n=1 Tax=Rubripirellula lacrimiformis TaxID=1930273 RepID=A0A517NFU8_9BACT|nr:hypothetical protein [Rubripirellula lacrimiformis]QDT05981.1 hypothetical protein K227x_43880 [Rubripirellula lacrimiformis]